MVCGEMIINGDQPFSPDLEPHQANVSLLDMWASRASVSFSPTRRPCMGRECHQLAVVTVSGHGLTYGRRIP